MHPVRYLLLPGWQDSDAAHWQSHWAQRPGFSGVQQHDWFWPKPGDWLAQLEEAVLADDRPAVLVAHSLGCHLAARWAGHSRHTSRVAAALLVAPPDLKRPGLPPQLQAWVPGPHSVLAALPFASTLVASTDDPWCSATAARALAHTWRSRCHWLQGAGHCNSASGLADWPAGWHLLHALCRQAGVAPPAAAKDDAADCPAD